MAPSNIFVGGYTKSGTTFIGRALGLFQGVYARGEMDYFRLFHKGLSDMVVAYNENLQFVNREVYDDQGELAPVTIRRMRELHEKIFLHLFFNGEEVPGDCKVIVEKSPRNIRSIQSIELFFPDAINVWVYREPLAVFRSMLRHMADHRDEKFHDAGSEERQTLHKKFLAAWPGHVTQIESHREKVIVIRYQKVADNTQAFLDYAEKKILREPLPLKAPVETLSKEYYLNSLPEEKRAKSLVQIGPPKMTLSEVEHEAIVRGCRSPDIDYDF